ncbi:MAG: hypothetical protein ACYCYM_12485 [Saccharofermentanales bacterium]
MMESKELFIRNKGIADDFALRIKNQHDLYLDFSRDSIQTLDEVFEKVKYISGDERTANIIGFAAYLGHMLITLFDGYWFLDNTGFGVELKNTAFGENIVVYPDAWVEKRLRNGMADSIGFKITALAVSSSNSEHSAKFCIQDERAAEYYAAQIKIDPADKKFMDQLVQTIINNRDSINLKDYSNASEKSRIYLKSRFIKLYDDNPFSWELVEKIENITDSLMNKSLKFSAPEYIAFLEYLQDASLDPNGDLFKNLWSVEEDSRFFEKSESHHRNKACILLIKLIENKRYHHNIIDFKKVLCLINPDNMDVLPYLQNLSVNNEQGCYQAIKYILNCSFSSFSYKNFDIHKQIIIWLDNATGKQPHNPWKEKLSAIESECNTHDLSVLCQWVVEHKEFRYDRQNHWLDSVFARFQKTAGWYLNKDH